MTKLQNLFAEHFQNSATALRRFCQSLQTAALPFDMISYLRELAYPPYPTFECGLPSLIYYYVPGTNWGSHHGQPADSIHPDFVYSGDGIGLNMGCPVRLARALELLFCLPEGAQKDCLAGLRNVHTHLPTVEELLWPTLWLGKSQLSRGGDLAGNGSDVDWFFVACGIPVYLEAKFRPSDWPRLSDMGTHQPMKDFFLGKAAHKFPRPRGPLTMHAVAVTGFGEPTSDLLTMCEDELMANPNVHVVLYRSMLGSVHVISLDRTRARSLAAIIKTPALEEYPPHYEVSWHRQSQKERVQQRLQRPQKLRVPSSKLHVIRVEPPPSPPLFYGPPPEYNCEITERKPDGEPIFKAIPKYLYPREASP